MRFLVLEDYFPLRQEIVDLIEHIGHEAFGVSNATEATILLKSSPFDAIICDIFVQVSGKFMPDGGILLITRVRRGAEELMIPQDAPILAITAGIEMPGAAGPRRLAINLGADEAYQKPVPSEEIAEWVLEASRRIAAGKGNLRET